MDSRSDPTTEEEEMRTKSVCPICGGRLTQKQIDYVDWHNGSLVVVKDVPVKECVENGHQILAARTAKEIEQLFDRFAAHRIQATQTLRVPVLALSPAVAR
jgi:YgiT-type zinc finger domain-containing protein